MNGWWATVKDAFELLSYVVVVLGGPVAIWHYIRATRREQDERLRERRDCERAVYDALDERYLDYLRLCLEHRALDIFDLPDAHPVPLSPEQRKPEQGGHSATE